MPEKHPPIRTHSDMERLRLALQVAHMGYWQINLPDYSVEWSEGHDRLFGIPMEQFGGTLDAVQECVHPEDRSHGEANLEKALEGDGVFDNTYRVIHPNGEVRWLHSYGHVCRDETNQPSYVFGITQDITSFKRAEELLVETNRRMQIAADSARFGVWDLDLITHELIWDDGMFRLYGASRDQFGGAYEAWQACVHPEDLRRASREVEEAKRGEKPFDTEFRIIRPDGQVRHLKATAIVQRNAQGDPIRMTGINCDITERVCADLERSSLEHQLMHAQKLESIGQLAGGVAHDFNNVLSIIFGHADLALTELPGDSPTTSHLLAIREAASRSANLTRQLLAFARRQSILPRRIDLNQAVEGILAMLRRLIGEDLEVAWRPGTALRPIHIDPSQLDQVLTNLCVNARDASGRGGRIVIETRTATLDEAFCRRNPWALPGRYSCLCVSDEGCGMDEEMQKHIFEPFFTTKAIGQGTGLGLATVYGILKQNDGCIEVRSAPGQGTTFALYFPCHLGEEARPEPAAPQEPRAATTTDQTLLLVEDEASVLKLTQIILEKQGYRVLAAHTPAEALRWARESAGDIDLLLTDVVMPEMNGRDLAREVRKLRPGIRRLFMSGYTTDTTGSGGELEPGVCFLQKPFTPAECLHAVRLALQTSPRTGGETGA